MTRPALLHVNDIWHRIHIVGPKPLGPGKSVRTRQVAPHQRDVVGGWSQTQALTLIRAQLHRDITTRDNHTECMPLRHNIMNAIIIVPKSNGSLKQLRYCPVYAHTLLFNVSHLDP